MKWQHDVVCKHLDGRGINNFCTIVLVKWFHAKKSRILQSKLGFSRGIAMAWELQKVFFYDIIW